MTYRYLCCCFLVIISSFASAQFMDDFSDGTLDEWQGDVDDFIINASERLQLNAPMGNSASWIYTPVAFRDSMEWAFHFRLDFAPSTSNQLRVYLGLDTDNIATASGYFLEIGATGDQDALELRYLDAGTPTLLASSAPGLVAAEPVDLSIRLTLDAQGIWTCSAIQGPVPQILFTTTHALFPMSNATVFGFNCRYTDTRRDRFSFDNINIIPYAPDTQAPEWVDLTVVSDRQLHLTFNEIIDSSIAVDISNYTLNPGGSNPAVVDWTANEVMIEFAAPFVSQQEYTLLVRNLEDASGNVITEESRPFTFIRIDEAGPYELLITEFMADPTPQIGLPDAEFIELYNASNKLFKLSDYQLTVGTSTRSLPDDMIMGGEYVILCDVDDVTAFQSVGRVVGISGFPSLTNSGTTLRLSTNSQLILHEITYTTSWYNDPEKVDGGWTIEMINPQAQCTGSENWAASVNLSGGTPGKVNSQWNPVSDNDGPQLISVFTGSPSQITLRFNEKLDPVLMENPAAYLFSPALVINDAVVLNNTSVLLTLTDPMTEGITYALQSFSAYDCLGNESMIPGPIEFGLVTIAEPGDVYINELLFNPGTGGSRFIEVINVSSKFIDLSKLAFARITKNETTIFPSGVNETLVPGGIAAFAPNRDDILSRYSVPFPNQLFTSSLPSWDDETDQVTLLADGVVLDSFTYDESWHHPLIADQNGVSLERISTSESSVFPSTWHSASKSAGYATPTGPNSQQFNPSGETDKPYSITNRIFSPNEDGFKDFLGMQFDLTTGDQIGSIRVHDTEGREIHRLATNELLGTSSLIQWDGRTADGELADMGMYILFIQLWEPSGEIREYQETCALVQR